MNESRNSIHNKSIAVHRGVCGLVLSSFIVQVAYADVSLPPPAVHQTTNNGFPSSQALKNQGYDPSTGVLRVDERNRGTSTVTKSGDTITGQQQKTVTVTGNYGEKGTMSTAATQKTSVSKLGTAANLAVIGSIAGQSQKENANKIGSQIAQGDYFGAASTSIEVAHQVLDNFTLGLWKGIPEGYNGISELRKAADNFNKEMYGGSASQQASQLGQVAQQAAAQQAQAERNGDLGGAIAQAAAAKAAQGAAEAAKKTSTDKENEAKGLYTHEVIFRIEIHSHDGSPVEIVYKNASFSHSSPLTGSNSVSQKNGMYYVYVPGYGKYLSIERPSYSQNKFSYAFASWKPQSGISEQAAQSISENMTLTGNDIQKILERMLESQQTNHKELMEQLAKMGDTVEQATTSKEFTPSVAYSDPYTPAGSDTPQQTRFEIDKNGNITTSTVSRPDLKPNSSQAPTRTVVIPNKAETGQQTGQKETGENTTPTTGETGQQTPTTGQTGQQTPTTGQTGQTAQTNQQNQQQKEFCEKNPNSAACAKLGEADYEDIAIPEQTIDLSFQPSSHFSTTGTCPMPRSVDFGMFGSHEFSYEPLCDFAAKIRPILIAITILSCAWFVSGALKEV
ncbi:virulence factor TspB C-terminal domain-related protein [Neisseria sp. N177_16]|uniref:virulence factor TspB C-terminal domain-related protein n=1 Tax=Neisseria sp. N177_16 TaxID=2056175 RepID=UPI000C27D8AE|nr:virulence factor TspB C-terminal domain-related protein [Neisseria sp. N177_16]PJO77692.1 hypothetical protein CWC45_08925 [Neisseria sp. N177_16]